MCMKDVQEGVFKNQCLYKNGSINELSSYSGSINKFRVKKKIHHWEGKLFFVGKNVILMVNPNENN